MSKARINFLAFRPCNRVAANVFANVVPVIPDVIDLRHRLNFFACPAKTVGADGKFGFGAFVVVRCVPEIHIADQKPNASVMDHEHEEQLLQTISHELAHYEQWRDRHRGRKLTERGVEVRARTITAVIRELVRSKWASVPGVSRYAKGGAA